MREHDFGLLNKEKTIESKTIRALKKKENLGTAAYTESYWDF